MDCNFVNDFPLLPDSWTAFGDATAVAPTIMLIIRIVGNTLAASCSLLLCELESWFHYSSPFSVAPAVSTGRVVPFLGFT